MEITTDYLIVGAGVMGMGFLDEIIRNSRKLEAVIVDIRDKPGGHWNDAYPFVRLHQPALTYGVNSRTLGVGGADLASKSQGWSSIDVTGFGMPCSSWYCVLLNATLDHPPDVIVGHLLRSSPTTRWRLPLCSPRAGSGSCRSASMSGTVSSCRFWRKTSPTRSAC